MKPVITSRWETDAYKLSMGQVFWQRFKNIKARYQFVDRNNLPCPKGLVEWVREQVDSMESLPRDQSKADYVSQKWSFVDPEYLFWYTNIFKHDPKQVHIWEDKGKLNIVVEGPIYEATHWEVQILRIVATGYNLLTGRTPKYEYIEEATRRARLFKERGVAWAEFGGRRPFSPEVHLEALRASALYKQEAKGAGGLIGTSWVEYAYQLGLMPIGTQAHEYTSLMGGVYGHKNANEKALEIWVKTFGTRLGYVLPDTYTTRNFLQVFTHGYADLFEGSRQDSGNPFKYVDIMLEHYRNVYVDPRTKSIIHSDSLRDMNEIFALNEYLVGRYLRSFGLGGIVTNNCGFDPFNMVAKLFAICIIDGLWIPTVKVPDNIAKAVGDPTEVAKVIQDLQLR